MSLALALALALALLELLFAILLLMVSALLESFLALFGFLLIMMLWTLNFALSSSTMGESAALLEGEDEAELRW